MFTSGSVSKQSTDFSGLKHECKGMASPSKIKRNSIGPYNVTIEDDMRHQLFGWKGSYNQRAVLVRVVCNGGRQQMQSGIHCVKFIDTDLIEQYGYPGLMPEEYSVFSYTGSNVSLGDLNGELKRFKQFGDFNLDGIWEGIFTIVEQCGYHFIPGHDGGWKLKRKEWTCVLQEEYNKLSTEQKLFLTTFETALKCDMSKGEAKAWMTKLVELMKSADNALKMLLTLEPSMHDGTNTEMEVINGDNQEDFHSLLIPFYQTNRPPSTSSDLIETVDSEERTPKIHRCTVVPDFCVLLPDYPGVFPLVAEMRPVNCELQGLSKNIGQMLSKMFFQDIVFGVVVTPTAYVLSVIMKKDKTDELLYQRAVVGLTSIDSDGNIVLDINNFKELCTFIYRVLKWSLITKCKL